MKLEQKKISFQYYFSNLLIVVLFFKKNIFFLNLLEFI